MGERMGRELLSVGVLLGLILATMALTFHAGSYFVAPLLTQVLIGVGALSCLSWVIVVMPRLMEG